MKYCNSFSKISTIILIIISLSVLTKCTNSTNVVVNCDGYTGAVTNKNAVGLQKICHFIPKDTIAVWTARYQKNKVNINSNPPTSGAILGDSCSFNNNIVKAIITNDSCIGLRVVYGMDEKNSIHILLVGIKPDYSTLYISKPINCGLVNNKDDVEKRNNNIDANGAGQTGGGEMGANP